MKKIIFFEINLLNLICSLFLKIFFKRVYYVNISENLRSQFLINLLDKINIIWFSYENLGPNYQTKFYSRLNWWLKSTRIARDLSNSYSKQLWDKNLKKNNLDKNLFTINIFNKIVDELSEKLEIAEISAILNKNNENIYLWVPNNKINRDIFKKYKNLKILTPKVFTLLDTLFQNSVFIIVKIIRIF